MNHPGVRPEPIPGSSLMAHPHTADAGGLCCFMDQGRVCGPECMAFLHPAPQTDPEMQGQQWARCHLLVQAHRAGKHLVILAADVHRATSTRQPAPGADIPPPIPR